MSIMSVVNMCVKCINYRVVETVLYVHKTIMPYGTLSFVADTDHFAKFFDLTEPVHSHSWVCGTCYVCYKNSNDLLSSFDITEGSADPVMVQCGRLIEDACTTIKEDGWLYTPPLIHGYRDFLVGLGKTH